MAEELHWADRKQVKSKKHQGWTVDGHELGQSWIPENKAGGCTEQIRSEQKQMAEWFESLKTNRRVQCLATSVFLTKH